jgi:DNA repair photolyase
VNSQLIEKAPTHLPQIEWLDRIGTVLHPTPMGEAPEVLGINLTRGCGQRCAFCSVRANPGYIGDQVLQVYKHTARQLASELAHRKQLPRAVFLSPASDPFPPLTEVQYEARRVIEVLTELNVQAWLMTRGLIRPAVLKTLLRKPDLVKVTVGMTTLDRALQRELEPLTASPSLRLRQISELRQMGISVRVALEPLIPGLTDTHENLEPLLDALARAGVRQLTAGYLFGRPGIMQNLQPVLEMRKADEEVAEAYNNGPWLTSLGMASARYLSRSQRQRGYARVMALASKIGIQVSVSGLLNPDFAAPRVSHSSLRPSQPNLPLLFQSPLASQLT